MWAGLGKYYYLLVIIKDKDESSIVINLSRTIVFQTQLQYKIVFWKNNFNKKKLISILKIVSIFK